MGTIYMINNLITNTKYIGQTTLSPTKRFLQHCMIAENTDRNLKLYNAMRKYGTENFELIVLEDNILIDELDNKEIYYISLYDTFNNGYNNTVGGGGLRGYHHSAETRKKMSIGISKSMWKINTPERTAKIIKAQKGRKFTYEHRKHISEACMGKRCGKDNSFYGKHHTDTTKQKLSLANTKYEVQQIDINTDKVINTFNSVKESALYCLDNSYTNAKLSSAMYRIYYTCIGKQKQAYNFKWKYIERCNDYSD